MQSLCAFSNADVPKNTFPVQKVTQFEFMKIMQLLLPFNNAPLWLIYDVTRIAYQH